jgi:glucokinase
VIGIGLDVGGTKILGVAIDRSGTVLAERRRPTVDDGPGLLDGLADLYRELVGEVPARQSPASPPLGIGVPGLVDREGVLRFAPNLLAASGTDIRRGVLDRVAPSPSVMRIDNDATCAAAGEFAFGAGAGHSDVLLVTLGTGIGGGIVAGGRIARGAGNFAGEIGHIVVDPQGPPCGCGRRGCWERYGSGSGLGRLARDAALAGRADRILALAGGETSGVRSEHVFSAASEGDEQASSILGEFAWWVALGLANLANVLDPSVIVIGGGMVRAGEALLGPVRRAFLEQVEGAEVRPPIEIVAATLGERGGAIGAAAAALETGGP